MQVKSESKNSISNWDEAIADAQHKMGRGKLYVAQLRAAIKSLERSKREGEPWPGESATPPHKASHVPQSKAATQ